MTQAENKLELALNAFDWNCQLVGAVRYGCGHINDTFCVHTQPKEGNGCRYILQRISSIAFPEPVKVMENMVKITAFMGKVLEEAGEDPLRGTLTLLHTKDGKPYFTDDEGQIWRAMYFVEDTECYQKAETPELFYASAKAFGRFQRLLGDFPAHTLYETIQRFHDTENRLNNLKKAIAEDKMGRAAGVQAEIAFAMARQEDCSVCMEALRQGILPLRVTHNDTKLNNILMDKKTGEGVCVIDLDTVMPGLSINDFGDSIRFGANHSTEDEKNLAKVEFDLGLYEIYTKGFLEEAASVLTEAEIRYMPWGAKLMTLECGMRFLTDYLEGDVYFHTNTSQQNLDRCRTQFKLVRDMEDNWEAMHDIVAKCAASLGK